METSGTSRSLPSWSSHATTTSKCVRHAGISCLATVVTCGTRRHARGRLTWPARPDQAPAPHTALSPGLAAASSSRKQQLVLTSSLIFLPRRSLCLGKMLL